MKRVVVRGPVLSQSGYGEHTRFVLRALRSREPEIDIYVIPTGWGQTGWITEDDDERKWLDDKISKTVVHMQSKLPFDVSVQVTIPNEWEKMAAVNIGVTAGIETTKVSPVWLEKSNIMDKIITVSEHSKRGFLETDYAGTNRHTGQKMHLKCNVPVECVSYPVKSYEKLEKLDLNLDYDFNFLAVAQWGPRKNMQNLIKWFIEENIDQEVGLVVKTSLKNCSVVDREYTKTLVRDIARKYPEKKCKVYLLHGDMTTREMHSLYNHPQIKCLLSLTHGEGFGLPLFEAAYTGLPIIAPGWSGHVDFLYKPVKSGKKTKKKAFFAEVDYNLSLIDGHAVWPGVLEKETMWCVPTEGSAKMRMRQVKNNYDKWLNKAKQLKKWVLQEFSEDKQIERLANELAPGVSSAEEEIDNIFKEMLSEGA